MKHVLFILLILLLGQASFAQSQVNIYYSSGGVDIHSEVAILHSPHSQSNLNSVASIAAFDFVDMAEEEGWVIPDEGVDIEVISTNGRDASIHVSGGWTGSGGSSIIWTSVSNGLGGALCAAGLSGCGGGGGGPLDLVY